MRLLYDRTPTYGPRTLRFLDEKEDFIQVIEVKCKEDGSLGAIEIFPMGGPSLFFGTNTIETILETIRQAKEYI